MVKREKERETKFYWLRSKKNKAPDLAKCWICLKLLQTLYKFSLLLQKWTQNSYIKLLYIFKKKKKII